MGCSRKLISIIHQICALAASCRAEGGLSPRLLTERLRLKNCLAQLKQYPPPHTSESEHLVMVAEAKRLAAMLYLVDRVPLKEASTPNHSRASQRSLVDAIIDALKLLPTTSAVSLWPLFVLGNSYLETDEQRHFVLDRLTQIEKRRRLGSVYHARRLVERKILSRVLASAGREHLVFSRRERPLTENERWISLA